MDNVKLKVFKGDLFEDDGKIRFINPSTKKIDEGYETFVNRNEFEKLIKVHAIHQGLKIDAYDENNKFFWSNYREVEVKADELESLKLEYEQLSGNKPKGVWGEKKLKEEIEKLK